MTGMCHCANLLFIYKPSVKQGCHESSKKPSLKTNKKQLGGRGRWIFCESGASLIYAMSSRIVRATGWDPVSTPPEKKKRKASRRLRNSFVCQQVILIATEEFITWWVDNLETKSSLLVLALPHTSLGQAQKGDGNVHTGRPTSA